MRLADFILRHTEAILAEWESFAATLLPAAGGMTSLALRDHAQQILEAVAHDLATPQTRDEQSEKSKGRAPKIADAPETAAQTHAVLRARGGFDIIQLVAEYRALRASVLRHWMDTGSLNGTGVGDIVRFNEAIDQAIAESVAHFHAQVEQARNLFLGMLGHDMRNPLYAIQLTAATLSTLNAGEQVSEAAGRLIRSGAAMQALLDDVMDFNRTRLGVGIRVVPADCDLAGPVVDEVEQFRATYPRRQILLAVSGDCRGRWDGPRVRQVIRNLVGNALKYGAADAPVRVALRAEEAGVRLEVTNSGPPIDPSEADELFEPLRRGMARGDGGESDSLGLGLFIVREITRAHGGEVGVRWDAGEVTFAVHLPRRTAGTGP
ncbi:MAG: two-component sensor histidine kinase [Isosphaera sp.]|nr:two-component sensor histidine kinase [Isosphaera sp.]